MQQNESKEESPPSQKAYKHPSQNKDVIVEVWRRTLRKWNPFEPKVVKPGTLALTLSI